MWKAKQWRVFSSNDECNRLLLNFLCPKGRELSQRICVMSVKQTFRIRNSAARCIISRLWIPLGEEDLHANCIVIFLHKAHSHAVINNLNTNSDEITAYKLLLSSFICLKYAHTVQRVNTFAHEHKRFNCDFFQSSATRNRHFPLCFPRHIIMCGRFSDTSLYLKFRYDGWWQMRTASKQLLVSIWSVAKRQRSDGANGGRTMTTHIMLCHKNPF